VDLPRVVVRLQNVQLSRKTVLDNNARQRADLKSIESKNKNKSGRKLKVRGLQTTQTSARNNKTGAPKMTSGWMHQKLV
jgi:hypothetical protein